MWVHCVKYEFREYRTRVRVVTKPHNGMEQNELFHSVVFQIPEAIQYLSLNPKY